MKRLACNSSSALSCILALFVAALCGCDGTKQPAANAVQAALPVDTVTVVSKKLDAPVSLPAQLLPYESVDVYPKVTGFIDSIRVDRGSRVKRGDVLIRLTAPELVAQRSQAESALRAAESQLASAQAKLAADQGTYLHLAAASKTPGVIAENDLGRHIRYRHRIVAANWSNADNLWTIDAERLDSGERLRFTTNFFWMCQGYYRHAEGYTPEWKDFDKFKGTVVHPQKWPEDLDYKGKRVIVIGSGATAATLVPNIADDVAWDHIQFSAIERGLMDKASIVCFGTLAQRHAYTRSAIMAATAAAPRHCLVVCDANLRQPWVTEDVLKQSFAAANLLKLNHDELQEIARIFGWTGEFCEKLSRAEYSSGELA